MRGDLKNIIGVITYDGHAWVCDGADQHSVMSGYMIEFLLGGSGYYYYTDAGIDPSESGYFNLYFHMNWGWRGMSDGWYSYDNVAPTGDSANSNYKYGRENLFVRPK